jgi:hypothetical protein
MTPERDVVEQIEKYLSGGQTLGGLVKWAQERHPVDTKDGDNALLSQIIVDGAAVFNRGMQEKDLRKAWRRMLNAAFMKGKR